MIGFLLIIGAACLALSALGTLFSLAAALASQLVTVGLIFMGIGLILMAIRDRNV